MDYQRGSSSITCGCSVGAYQFNPRFVLGFGCLNCYYYKKQSQTSKEDAERPCSNLQPQVFKPKYFRWEVLVRYNTVSSKKTKRQKLAKLFNCLHQTFVDVTELGNSLGSHRNNSFLVHFRIILAAIMSQESRFVVLPYPGQLTTSKCRPFQGDASVISDVIRLFMYVEQLWLRDGEDIVVKLFVAHDTQPVSFNPIDYVTVCNDFKGAVSVSSIQASSTIRAGYLVGSCRTQNDNTGPT